MDHTINVTVSFIGFYTIYEEFKEPYIHCLEYGQGLTELITDLVNLHGEWMKKELLDSQSQKLDPVVQIRVNETMLKRSEIIDYRLNDNDQVGFYKLLAGG